MAALPVSQREQPGSCWQSAIDRLAAAHLERMPFSWALIDGLLDDGLARLLADQFPERGYRISSTQTDYTFLYRGLVSEGVLRLGNPPVAAEWAEFGKLLASAAYRQAMEELTGRSLAGLKVYAGFCRYEPGCVLRPHTDRPIRAVTQTIYFNRDWDDSWGGALLLLRSADRSDVQRKVTPAFGRSVVFVRSDHSWHGVERVRRGIPVVRRSLLLHFSR